MKGIRKPLILVCKEGFSDGKRRAIGYMILAAKQAGVDEETIKCIEALMEEQMDFYDEQEAELSYQGF